jgi:hypothetical protein
MQCLRLWCFLNFLRTPLSLSVNCWRGGVPIEGEQEGESRPFRGRKGQVFPTCEPRKDHLESTEAKGQKCSIMKMRIDNTFSESEMGFGQQPICRLLSISTPLPKKITLRNNGVAHKKSKNSSFKDIEYGNKLW